MTLKPVSDEIDLDYVNEYIIYHEENGEKKYLCKICSQSSHLKGTIKRHLETVHTKATYDVCQFCSRTFKNKYSLKVHHAQSVRCKLKLRLGKN